MKIRFMKTWPRTTWRMASSIACLVFVFGQCKSKDSGDVRGCTTLKADLDAQEVSIHEVGLIEGCDLIKLHTADEVLIGNIDQVVVYDRYLYVADYYKSKTIFIFDTEGNFVNKIDRSGRAGDEYMQLRTMWVDPVRQTLNFISRVDRKMFVYDLKGEKLLKVDKLPKSFAEMVGAGGMRVGYSENYIEDKQQPYNVWLLDSNNAIVNGYLEIDPAWESSGFRDGRSLSVCGNKIYHVMPMDFQVRLLSPDGISSPWYYDFGKYRWPGADIGYEERKELLNSGREFVDRIYRFQETDDFLLAEIVFKGQTKLVVYEKSTGKINVCALSTYTDRYFIPFGRIVSLDEKHLITAVPARDVKRCCEGDEFNDFEKEYPRQIGRMKALFPDIRESDNPFIVIYAL